MAMPILVEPPSAGSHQAAGGSAIAPLPFEQLLEPLVRAAAVRAWNECGADGDLLGPRARAGLERALLTRIARVTSRPLFASFTTFRSSNPQLAFAALFGGADGPSRVAYRAFVSQMQGGGWERWLRAYPVAAAMCERLAELWIESTAELAHRVARDAGALARRFNGGAALGAIDSVDVGVGDTHDGGRSVLIATFASGRRIVYKPRALELELIYATVVRRLRAERAAMPRVRTPLYLARPDYGWVEFIEERECTSPSEVREFYRRMGAVLALVHALNGYDFHYENLIVHGAHPILIDLEGLVRQQIVSTPAASAGAIEMAQHRLRQSVTETGLLPFATRVAGEHFVDVGGMRAGELELADGAESMCTLAWRDVNSDAMGTTLIPMASPDARGAPMLHGRPQYATDFVSDIVDGFGRAYDVLLSARDRIFDRALLDEIGTRHARVILRPTQVYMRVIDQLLHPDRLRSPAERDRLLDRLRPSAIAAAPAGTGDALHDAERRALEQMDVPLFTSRISGMALESSATEPIDGYFVRSALDQLRQRLDSLSAADREHQSMLIRITLHGRRAGGWRSPIAPPPTAARTSSRATDVVPSTDALRDGVLTQALALAETIEARAIRGGDGAAAWIGASYVPALRYHATGVLPPTLFSGSAGLALFFAAVHAVSGDARWRSVSEAAVQPLRTLAATIGAARDDAPAMTQLRHRWSAGLGEGAAGAVYALTRLGDLLHDRTLYDDAHRIALLIDAEDVRARGEMDLFGGAAGIVVALLALAERVGDDELVRRARELGELLAVSSHAGDRIGRVPMGLALGGAGRALALRRLHRICPDDRWLAAAESDEACDAEELDAMIARAKIGASCADGIAGSLLAACERCTVDRTGDRARVERWANHLCGDVWPVDDSLSTGAMGRADALVAASAVLGDLRYASHATMLYGEVLAHWQGGGAPRLGWGPDLHIGLLGGAPGVAYALMRATSSSKLPSVIAFD